MAPVDLLERLQSRARSAVVGQTPGLHQRGLAPQVGGQQIVEPVGLLRHGGGDQLLNGFLPNATVPLQSPNERATFSATPPQERAAFLRRFWAKREPDLATPLNERLGEHFRRFEEAGQFFKLLHPNSMYFQSPLYRTLSGGLGGAVGPGTSEYYNRAYEASCDAFAQSACAVGVEALIDEPPAP